MAGQWAELACELFQGAFSGEVVFAVQTPEGVYEGVAPRHYARPAGGLSAQAVAGTLRVRVIRNGGKRALVATPDGEAITVPAAAVLNHA
jgi:hypothetical protein